MISRKSHIVLIIMVIFLLDVIIFAGPKVVRKEINGKRVHNVRRNGKRVRSCRYCHVTAKFPKRKNMYLKGQDNFKKLSGNKYCSGPECHR